MVALPDSQPPTPVRVQFVTETIFEGPTATPSGNARQTHDTPVPIGAIVGGAAGGADEQAEAPVYKPAPRHETPIQVVLTRYAAQILYAPLRTVEQVAGIGSVYLRRDLALDTLLQTLPVHARALA